MKKNILIAIVTLGAAIGLTSCENTPVDGFVQLNNEFRETIDHANTYEEFEEICQDYDRNVDQYVNSSYKLTDLDKEAIYTSFMSANRAALATSERITGQVTNENLDDFSELVRDQLDGATTLGQFFAL